MAKRFKAPAHWTVQQRLDHYTIPEALTGCHLCWASPGSRGYPSLKIKDFGQQLTHRLAWMIARGPIPEGMLVCHRCDTPACINIDHLFLGTQAENMTDMKNKNRSPRSMGTANPNVRLTDQQVHAIFNDKRILRIVAKEHGTSINTIQDIRTGRTWRHLTMLTS